MEYSQVIKVLRNLWRRASAEDIETIIALKEAIEAVNLISTIRERPLFEQGSVRVNPIQTPKPPGPKAQPHGVKTHSCKEIDFGSYKCAIVIDNVQCDKCLSDEVLSLNSMGIKTTGSCCGHSRVQAYIQVDDDSVQKMHDLGYEAIPIDKFGNGSNAFIPKSNLEVEE